MRYPILPILSVVACLPSGHLCAQAPLLPFEAPPHSYWDRTPQDPFSRWVESSRPDSGPPPASEKEAVQRLLRNLDVPESSQMLIFSATSLQRTISPHRPRAMFFNDEVYVAWVPDGRVEIAADDPQAGPVFFIASLSEPWTRPLEPDRQKRCMNCHAPADDGGLPSLLLTSTLPNDAGGSLDKFREPGTGHHVPLAQRFGGWHVTGINAAHVPHANVIGAYQGGKIAVIPNKPGDRSRLEDYPRDTSDILPQLILEHQSGAVNLLTRAIYLAREMRTPDGAEKSREAADRLADGIVRYFLFANEAALPPGGITGHEEYSRAFTKNRKPDKQGRALKDLSLRSHIFQNRCSYMVYLPMFTSLPAVMKDRIWQGLALALAESPSAAGAHLPAAERAVIRSILADTCQDLPASWQR